MCLFFVPRENQWERRLFQGSPELFSPSVMREREELWGRDCALQVSESVLFSFKYTQSNTSFTQWLCVYKYINCLRFFLLDCGSCIAVNIIWG